MKPADSFVPLTAATAPSTPREFRVAILNGHDHNHNQTNGNGNGSVNGNGAGEISAFAPLEASRPAAHNSLAAAEKKVGEPRVTVQRDGDRITHLRIQCTCGMVVELACVYEAQQTGA